MAKYRCRDCRAMENSPRRYRLHYGNRCRCPRCGTFRVEKLRGIDHIDPMYKNPFSYLQKWFGAALHWCPYCRLQFYDIRKKLPTPKRPPPGSVEAASAAKAGE